MIFEIDISRSLVTNVA